jgi:hypothetical protein
MARGSGEGPEGVKEQQSTPHAVSADGSRVFFEAVPGSNCSQPSHLYMREGGETTIDLGPYAFFAADPSGSRLLLRDDAGELFLYETETATLKALTYGGSEPHPLIVEGTANVSAGFSAIYFQSHRRLTPEAPLLNQSGEGPGDSYRYDLATEALSFLLPGFGPHESGEMTPDGRYVYSEGSPRILLGATGPGADVAQFFRYDSATNLIQCVSCASPSDPEPKLPFTIARPGGENGILATAQGIPRRRSVSGDGRYAFFDTPAALLPSDVDGEVAPSPCHAASEQFGEPPCEFNSTFYSPSSDVYEWRADGVDGCAHMQGCLALITNGRGGYLNALLGTTESGHDVFFTTASQLLPRDSDTALDIYDARTGGGFAEPSHPVECEGDSCAAPFAPPSDVTPSSSTFQGAGNLLPGTLPQSGTAPKPKPKKTCKAKAKRKCKAKPRKKTKKARGRRAGIAGRDGRAGR